jgi:hypothetical protein
MYDGYVFFCTKTSQQACLSNRRYTCADEKTKPDEKIKEGSVIFLYNTDEKTLLGPFTALTEGAKELDDGAWAEDIDTHIPSEDIKVTWENLHVLRDAPTHLPYLKTMKTCRLTTLQTQRALDVLKSGEVYTEKIEHAEP